MTTSSDNTSQTDTRSIEQLPKIDIIGTAYTVDWKNRKLLPPKDSEASVIELDSLPVTPGDLSYQCLYRPETQSQVAIEASMTKLPPGVVILDIPPPEVLDPIAVAVEVKIPVDKFLRQFPVLPGLSARQVPWETSKIKELTTQERNKSTIERETINSKKRQRKL